MKQELRSRAKRMDAVGDEEDQAAELEKTARQVPRQSSSQIDPHQHLKDGLKPSFDSEEAFFLRGVLVSLSFRPPHFLLLFLCMYICMYVWPHI